MYSVRARGDSTANDRFVAALWNGHATQRVGVRRIACWLAEAAAANSQLYLFRLSARGTPGSTVTPDINTDHKRGVAPASGVVLDLGPYTAEPTPTPNANTPIEVIHVSTDIAGKAIFNIAEQGTLWIPPGAGIGIRHSGSATTFPAVEVTFYWIEDS